MSRSRRHHPVAWFLVLLVLVVVLDTAAALARLAPLLVTLATTGAGVWLLARRRGAGRSPERSQVIPGHVEDDETEQLRAENAWLRRRLAEATDQAHAAWQATRQHGDQDATADGAR